MPENAFVPLLRPGAAALSQNGFSPLGLKTIHSSNGHAQSAPQSPPAQPCQEPIVTLQRDGDKITAIHIQCSCGQILDLACEY